MRRKVIIDCDPGHDDVLAILTAYAHPEYFDILGITTVAGNQTVDKVTDNMLKVEDYVGMDIPVSKGYDAPLVRPAEPQPLAHGESGLDGFIFPETTRTTTGIHAVDFIRDQLQANEHVTIIALAPLTNLAMVIKTYPELAKRIDQIVLMGGGIGYGNIQTMSEFNIYHDPESAYLVFNSDVPVVMAPLEACYSGSIYLSECASFKNGGRISQMLYGLLDFYCGYARARNWDSTAIFDLLPVVYLMHPEYFETEKMNVDIEMGGRHTRGMTVCDRRQSVALKDHATTVMIKVDRDKLIETLMSSIALLEE